MIDPKDDDIGRSVIYDRTPWLSAGSPNKEIEEGVITSFNDVCVFVRYGSEKGSKGTSRRDLEWVNP